MRAITFEEKNVNINGKQVPADGAMLVRMIDDAVNEKTKAVVKVLFFCKTITLFEGQNYKPINEYTEQEIDNRIIELI